MSSSEGLTTSQRALKRTLDLCVSVPALLVVSPIMWLAWLVATVTTGSNGLFRQERVGLDGQTFEVLKFRTMRGTGGSTVTTASDLRVTRAGRLMRRLKIDELPQLINVVRGEMSLVGPRPDVPGFADQLMGPDRLVLSVRPGITGPAAVAFRHEEALLAECADPEKYNRETIWPQKVALNRAYVEQWTLRGDLVWLWRTVRSVLASSQRTEGSTR